MGVGFCSKQPNRSVGTAGRPERRCCGLDLVPEPRDRWNADVNAAGAGTTHARPEIYVPGSGWIAYDPSNGTIGGL